MGSSLAGEDTGLRSLPLHGRGTQEGVMNNCPGEICRIVKLVGYLEVRRVTLFSVYLPLG